MKITKKESEHIKKSVKEKSEVKDSTVGQLNRKGKRKFIYQTRKRTKELKRQLKRSKKKVKRKYDKLPKNSKIKITKGYEDNPAVAIGDLNKIEEYEAENF